MRSFLAACLLLGMAGAACAQGGDAIVGGANSTHGGYRLYGNDGSYRGRIESGRIYGADGSYRGRIESGRFYANDGSVQGSLQLTTRGAASGDTPGARQGGIAPAMDR